MLWGTEMQQRSALTGGAVVVGLEFIAANNPGWLCGVFLPHCLSCQPVNAFCLLELPTLQVDRQPPFFARSINLAPGSLPSVLSLNALGAMLLAGDFGGLTATLCFLFCPKRSFF